MKTIYLHAITLIQVIPCLAEPGKWIVVGRPASPLAEVLPYLATLPGVIAYNPANGTLTFRRPRGFLTLSSEKITITQVDSVEQGLELFEALKDAVNATWAHRAELTPAAGVQKAPRLLDLWEMLPRSNCGNCGEATCLAFAAALLLGNRLPDECPILQNDPVFADRRSALLSLIARAD
jgi:ArsR family metal-binding transcriptional regulator